MAQGLVPFYLCNALREAWKAGSLLGRVSKRERCRGKERKGGCFYEGRGIEVGMESVCEREKGLVSKA